MTLTDNDRANMDDTYFDPGWECDRCGHVNDDGDTDCAGEKCVAFRKWADEENRRNP